MKAGDLNDVVQWRRRRLIETTKSGYNREEYSEPIEMRCTIMPPSGMMTVKQDKYTVDGSAKLYIRKYYDVHELDRIVIDGVDYYVDFVSVRRRAGMKVLTVKREL